MQGFELTAYQVDLPMFCYFNSSYCFPFHLSWSCSIFIAFVLEAFLLQLDLVKHPHNDTFSQSVQDHLAVQ